jgi:hypothetical protein
MPRLSKKGTIPVSADFSKGHDSYGNMERPESRLDKDFNEDPERVRQQSPERKLWELMRNKKSALKGRRRLCRPFRAGFPDDS